MKEVQITKGYVAIVDDEDFEMVSSRSWHVHVDKKRNCTYALTDICSNGGHKTLSMHCFLVKPEKGYLVDHRNQNGLDNRRDNLRVCTSSQNKCNSPKRRDSKNKYKGVSFRCNKWRAAITKDGVKEHLGSFHTEIEAAMAYDRRAVELHGEFAYTNNVMYEIFGDFATG